MTAADQKVNTWRGLPTWLSTIGPEPDLVTGVTTPLPDQNRIVPPGQLPDLMPNLHRPPAGNSSDP